MLRASLSNSAMTVLRMAPTFSTRRQSAALCFRPNLLNKHTRNLKLTWLNWRRRRRGTMTCSAPNFAMSSNRKQNWQRERRLQEKALLKRWKKKSVSSSKPRINKTQSARSSSVRNKKSRNAWTNHLRNKRRLPGVSKHLSRSSTSKRPSSCSRSSIWPRRQTSKTRKSASLFKISRSRKLSHIMRATK